ncbi:MAG: helix-turn-helix domain-containing protein [Actinobacteria bacterium]|jgi:transcriptional regulator with XRE-family HTH domain|nr:helix-turn-helix domain-containing protein [Actinomycetota bacterium]MCL6104541.1 helix-turn-helix domain-containing protein [Actinomycetota bacterium]
MSNNEPQDVQPFRIYTAASIGQAIRHYRLQAGLTQAQLADQAGLTVSYLSRLENGQETEQLRRIVRILKLLGMRMTVEQADW